MSSKLRNNFVISTPSPLGVIGSEAPGHLAYILSMIISFCSFKTCIVALTFQADYNTPQKLDRGIRCMIACHTDKEVVWLCIFSKGWTK